MDENIKEQLEKARIQLAACGVAALCNTEVSIKNTRLDRTGLPYDYVCDAVDREIELRKKSEKLESANKIMKETLNLCLEHLPFVLEKEYLIENLRVTIVRTLSEE